MKKGIMLGILALFLVGLFGSAYAFEGKFFGQNKEVQDALESNDYNSWKNAMSESLTEERFNDMIVRRENRHQMDEEIYNAIESGDYDTWLVAMQNSDCPKGVDLTEKITEDNFDLFVQMHNARENKDFELANELAEDLEIRLGFLDKQRSNQALQGRGQGRGMHRFAQ